ncbi:MAG: siphovirus ReqiPepy6 Gp37-like family protein [Christensenellales bacterium]|jgi:hypothetical protein
MIEAYDSLQWLRRWHEPGEFELHVPYTEEAARLLKRESILVKGTEAGVIEAVYYSGDKADEIECRGYSLAGYAKRRIILDKLTITGTPEEIMLQLAERNIGPSAGPERSIPGLTVDSASGFSGEEMAYQSERGNLCDELRMLSEQSGLGWDIQWNGDGTMTFKVLKGLDRTQEQEKNSWAIFSRGYENISRPQYEEDARTMKNVALVTAQVNNNELAVTVGDAAGYIRREMAVNASGVDKDENGNALTKQQSEALMRSRGETDLADNALARSFSGDVSPVGNLIYRQDYDLGDVATCLDERWGLAVSARITEVKEIYEKNGFTLSLTFGKSVNFWRWLNG